MFDDAVWAYTAMLAALKAGAAFVPLDPGFPADRVGYIVSDAAASAVLTLEHLRSHLEEMQAEVVCVDEPTARLAALPPGRLTPAERGPAEDDPLAYIIYTSGSTGRPKGVAIDHPSIVSFVRVAAEVYGIGRGDRMYQGMTIAFDFSVEEIWVPWAAGATLVPKPAGASLLGPDLHEFLLDRRVTAMACVPTLLSTIEEDLPDLRFLLVSGEACPHDLIVRWHKPGRRFLNVYGPTEATVTATWTPVDPDRAVTIGVPLPTYSVVVLDPDDPHRALPLGGIGELGIAGIGLARGYVNRDDLTEKAFIPDFLGLPANPSKRIYRTGDLCRINEQGEIEYHGRIDLQVKIRGYRIELTEIESVLLQVPGISGAVVDTYEPVPGTVELVGYYSVRTDTATVDPEEIYAVLRDRLPSYMVPAYLEHLDVIPLTTSDKADRKNLPPPRTRRATNAGEHVEPATDAERVLADALARTLGVDRVSVTSHFFEDLGGNSLLMSQFSTRVRKETDLSAPSIRDIYQHSTVRALAALLAGAAPEPKRRPAVVTVVRGSAVKHALTGLFQVLSSVATVLLGTYVMILGLRWIAGAAALVNLLERSLVFAAASFVASCLVPIALKWLLVGRWKEREFPLWGAAHFRFWFVSTLVRVDPLVLFAGSPLYVFYLRALGAKIGRGVAVFSGKVPICTDLLTIGDGTVIRRDSSFTGYRAQAGRIRTGRVTIGRDAIVGEATVLDIGTVLGDRAQLGHASSLHAGQVVPDGESWHGSPARITDTDFRTVEPRRCGTLRRAVHTTLQLALIALFLPVVPAVVVLLLREVPWLAALLGPGHAALSTVTFYLVALALSVVPFAVGLPLGFLVVITVPRLLNKFVRPGVAHPLYGVQWWINGFVGALTNTGFTRLLGDSAYITHFLTALGYRLRPVEQTGSNFGLIIKHDTPYLTSIGTGSMISDGLTVANVDHSSTSFRVAPVAIGRNNFLGNHITYPTRSVVGDNCLIATKAMVPIDGPVRQDVGLLGSPAFEIPRSVQRDGQFDHLKNTEAVRVLIRAKTRHNTVTIALHLFVLWILSFAGALALLATVDLYYLAGAPVLVAGGTATLVFSLATLALVERASMGFRRMSPQFCSIYDRYFWRHERFWKLTTTSAFDIFNGTALKGVMWRLLGVRVGRRLFDDGCSIPEKTLVEIGDDCTLNGGTALWGHSLEDGTFKSDRIAVGDGCTLGVGAFALYGVTVGAGSTLDADAFLMKGEEVEAGTRWGGNPAREIPNDAEPAPLPAVRPSARTALVLAGLVAVTLPAGVTVGVTGTELTILRTAATEEVPLTNAPPDGRTDEGPDAAGATGTAEADDTAVTAEAATTTPAAAATRAVPRPATTRAATAATKAPTTKAPTTKAPTAATTTSISARPSNKPSETSANSTPTTISTKTTSSQDG
jgi:non-ribosomal peptide synthetase-like protein